MMKRKYVSPATRMHRLSYMPYPICNGSMDVDVDSREDVNGSDKVREEEMFWYEDDPDIW